MARKPWRAVFEEKRGRGQEFTACKATAEESSTFRKCGTGIFLKLDLLKTGFESNCGDKFCFQNTYRNADKLLTAAEELSMSPECKREDVNGTCVSVCVCDVW